MVKGFLSPICPECHVCSPEDRFELLHGPAAEDGPTSRGRGLPISSVSREAKA
jgi:hypothetical protein